MAQGDFSVRLNQITVTLVGANTVEVCGAFTRSVEDSDGSKETEGLSASLAPMTRAAFGAKTGLDLRNELIAQLQANVTKVSTVS